MEAIGGLVGVAQDKASLAVEPIAGWAIREASRLDVLLKQIERDHEIAPHLKIDAELKQVVEDSDTLRSRDVLPPDMARFYYEFASARLHPDGDSEVQLLARNEIEPVDWGEEKDDVPYRGPDDRTWHRFGRLPNGDYLAVNLDLNLHLVAKEEDFRERSLSESFHPICVYSELTRGVNGKNPVIALSFTELLSRVLGESGVTKLYWQSPEFEPYADAEQLTRRERIDDFKSERQS